MSTLAIPTARPKSWFVNRVTVGRALSAFAVLFLLFDAGIKLTGLDIVAQTMTQLGYPVSSALGIGLVELACIVLYVVPRTSVLGVVILTGYLGGAVASHVRVGNPVFSHVLFPVYIAILLWAGLYLRDSRLGVLLSLRRDA
jgi:hypothetical protein